MSPDPSDQRLHFCFSEGARAAWAAVAG